MKSLLTLSKSLFFSLILIFSFSVNSQAETAEESAARLQNKYDAIQSFTFDFVQQTRGQLTGRPKIGRGRAYFVKNTKSILLLSYYCH